MSRLWRAIDVVARDGTVEFVSVEAVRAISSWTKLAGGAITRSYVGAVGGAAWKRMLAEVAGTFSGVAVADLLDLGATPEAVVEAVHRLSAAGLSVLAAWPNEPAQRVS